MDPTIPAPTAPATPTIKPLPGKINVALQFWDGDRTRAMHLARFIADLEPSFNNLVDFTFVARWDAQHDDQTVEYVSKKFKTWKLKGRRTGTGWPRGCNDLALDLLQQSAMKVSRKEWPDHKALYLIESDVMPLCRDWLARLAAEWDDATNHGKFVLGAWCPFHATCGHINGNMLVAPDIARRLINIDMCPVKSGWDAYLAYKFEPHWAKSKIMQNHYDNRANIPEEVLWSSVDGVTESVVVHGVKDMSAEMQVRDKLGM